MADIDFSALPASRAEIRRLQSARKIVAFERAKTLPWYRGKLDQVRAAHLDEPEEWAKIPLLTKDELRQFDHAGFMQQFCCAPPASIVEYWRSGGSTGKPVFYPRTSDDVDYGLLSWGRSLPCMGIGPGDLCHISFPIGVHPAGQVWARSAKHYGVGMVWAGAGNSMPSEAQLQLIDTLKPTVLMGMSSFLLHLANLGEANGMELTASSVKKIVCSAEQLSLAKREKLARQWGAEVYDVFGMSEAGLMGAENAAHDGIHIWTDLYHVEVVDPATGVVQKDGDEGEFCVTPLWTNHATPFLRWCSGDIVRLIDRSAGTGRYADLFPVIRHANRTTGFFKVRGVNVNHTEFEDLLFRDPAVNDFQAVLETGAAGLEQLRVILEVRRDANEAEALAAVAAAVKRTFEMTIAIEAVERGTLAREFAKTLKATRFVDRRV